MLCDTQNHTSSSELEGPAPLVTEGMSLHPIMLDLDLVGNEDPPHLLPNSGPCQKCMHYCPGFQVTVPEGQTPFMEWPWLEHESMAMSMSVLIENGALMIHAVTCMGDGEP